MTIGEKVFQIVRLHNANLPSDMTFRLSSSKCNDRSAYTKVDAN